MSLFQLKYGLIALCLVSIGCSGGGTSALPDSGLEQPDGRSMLDAGQRALDAGHVSVRDALADATLLADSAAHPGEVTLPGSDAASLPRPSPACGSDLNLELGSVRPDFGVVPNGGAFVGDLEQPGPHAVSQTDVQVPIIADSLSRAGLTISVDAGVDQGTVYMPDGAGPFPLALLLAGFQASYRDYVSYSTHFASHGIAVLGLDTRSVATTASHDKEAFEVLQAIGWLTGADSPFAEKLDASKIAVTGHSKGGKISFFAAALDARVDLVIGWDPVNSGGPPCFLCSEPDKATCPCNALPVAPNCDAMQAGIENFMHAESLVIGAPPDALLNPDENTNCTNFYRGAPSPAAFVKLQAGHGDWLLSADVIRISKTVSVALLLARFGGVTGLDKWLPRGSYLTTQSLVTQIETK